MGMCIKWKSLSLSWGYTLHSLGAQFRTAISLILDGKEYLFEGIVKGEIIKEKRGGAGFGYDPVFQPEGYEQTFAELGNEIKNQISHRARAVQQLCEFLHGQKEQTL